MKPILGATFAEPDYDSHLARFPRRPAACRVFSAGDALPAWDDPRVAKLVKAGVTPFLSVKGYNPAKFRKALDSMPGAIPAVIVAHHHEPEGDQALVPAAVWAVRQRALYDMACGHRNRPRIRYVTIQTKQWTENTAGRTYQRYWAGASDAFAVDAYLNSWGSPASYGDPRQWCARMLDFAATTGKPLWLPELGAVTRPADPTDTGRADWIAGVLDQITRSGLAELAMWWCAKGSTGRDFHLHPPGNTAAPAQQVWDHIREMNP